MVSKLNANWALVARRAGWAVLLAAVLITTSAPSFRAQAARQSLVIAFLGDDLTAGDGLTSLQAVPAQVQSLFRTEGYSEVSTLNASSSGDTSASGSQRIRDVFQPDVRIVVVALGANDAIHGIAPANTHDNLAAIVTALEANGLAVMLVGVDRPLTSLPLDNAYLAAFRSAFDRIAVDHKGVAYVPSLLEGVTGKASLLQSDGIHPNPRGAQAVAEHLYPQLRTVVDRLTHSGPVR